MNWEYFTRDELACQGTGECDMNEDFMYKLMTIREELDRPMILSSAYRHPAHNSAINGAKDSPHIYGRAVDVHCMGHLAYHLIEIAIKHGMTGIGVSQRGNHDSRFIHIDDMSSDTHPRPWVWSYK
jgi:zinc D-Ala-D-Ala carboxypeptidase